MNVQLCLLLVLSFLICIIVRVDAQEFNVFKSYKDAKIKPKRYGAKIQRNHDISEYLNENQMKMMMSRNGANKPGEVFDNNWSGYDKTSRVTSAGPRKRNKSGKNADPSNSNIEGDHDASIDRRLDVTVEPRLYSPFTIFQSSYLSIVIFSCSLVAAAVFSYYWYIYPKAVAKIQNV